VNTANVFRTAQNSCLQRISRDFVVHVLVRLLGWLGAGVGDWLSYRDEPMKISEKELSRILQQPGYSVQAQHRQPKAALPAEVKELLEGSKHETKFKRLWQSLNGPKLEREYRFDPPRRWRIDFYHPSGLAIEIEGFGHGRPSRYRGDVEKYNRMAEMGIELRRLTSDMITVQELERIIERIEEKA
jgi:hypothetical protein